MKYFNIFILTLFLSLNIACSSIETPNNLKCRDINNDVFNQHYEDFAKKDKDELCGRFLNKIEKILKNNPEAFEKIPLDEKSEGLYEYYDQTCRLFTVLQSLTESDLNLNNHDFIEKLHQFYNFKFKIFFEDKKSYKEYKEYKEYEKLEKRHNLSDLLNKSESIEGNIDLIKGNIESIKENIKGVALIKKNLKTNKNENKKHLKTLKKKLEALLSNPIEDKKVEINELEKEIENVTKIDEMLQKEIYSEINTQKELRSLLKNLKKEKKKLEGVNNKKKDRGYHFMPSESSENDEEDEIC